MELTNQEMANALVIGRTLERMAWYDMSAKEAQLFCQNHESVAGLPELQRRKIAVVAMQYIINGR